MKKYAFLAVIFASLASVNATANECVDALDLNRLPHELHDYQAIAAIKQTATRNPRNFAPMQGLFVTHRDAQGNPTEGFIRVLSDNPKNHISVTGDFNNWNPLTAVDLAPDSDPNYVVGTIRNLRHGMQYRLVVNGQQVIDPAALAQSTREFNERIQRSSDEFLNSVFWDIEGVGGYTPRNQPQDLRAKPIVVSENDILSLAAHWVHNRNVGPSNRNQTYNFIADSGVIQRLREWGINAVEFLPLTVSVDGDIWAHRYLSYAPFAIDTRWGTPADFARMVDAFNGAGIGVVLDIVPGHYTQRGNEGIRDISAVGKHNFVKADGRRLYGETITEWNTFRYDYENPYVRRYLIDGVLNLLKYYGLSGIRVDNFGGIQGLPGGPLFLRELSAAVRAYYPAAWMNAESFGGDNAITQRPEVGGYGYTTHNNGDFFSFIFENAQRRTEEIDMNQLRWLLRNPWGWRESAALNYNTNHDEAANSRGRASGAYFASLVNGGGWYYVEGKTRVFTALAMLSGSFYLDMPHLRLLQEGTFYQNAAVEWSLLRLTSQNNASQFFADLSNYYISQQAFAFQNTHPDFENHTDYDNKIISIRRIDFQTGKEIYILINLGDRAFTNYGFGVSSAGDYHIVIDSDNLKYGGSSRLGAQTQGVIRASDRGLHGKAHALHLPYLAPYSVTVFERR